MSIAKTFRRALGLDRDDEQEYLYPDGGADAGNDSPADNAGGIPRSDVPATTGQARSAVDLPASLVDALEQAVTAWRMANEADIEKERREWAEKLEEMRLSAERQKRSFAERIADLTGRLSEAEAKKKTKSEAEAPQEPAAPLTVADDAERDRLVADNKRLAEEVDSLKQLNEQLDMKSRMTDKMLSDTNAKYGALRKEHEELAAQLQAIEELQQQFELVKQTIEKKDARIAALQKENADKDKTIEQNFYNQAHSEMRLRQEIKQLRKELEAKPASERKRRRKPGIDDNEPIDNGDRFDPAPPADSSFGYAPPARPGHNDIPDVPTLF